jgi:hypothetical protein
MQAGHGVDTAKALPGPDDVCRAQRKKEPTLADGRRKLRGVVR